MTLIWMPEGPMIKYSNSFIEIEDLNPEVKMRWRMSRTEMARLGWRCLLAAIRGR
jgi:hypothetical protein